jgi:zinc protease
VLLKPTDFQNDEILMTAWGLGGTSLAPDEDYMSVSSADDIINKSGVGAFNSIDLNKFMTGKNVTVRPSIDGITQGFQGRSVKKDLETMLQLTYLYFTEPRKDTTAFQTFQNTQLSQYQFMLSNPQAVFYDTIFKLATQNNPRTIVIPTVDQIKSIDLDVAYDFYKSSFGSAKGFTFVFVGSFKTDSLIPLITKYLGSIPGEGKAKSWKDVSPEFPDGITDATVRMGSEPKASVALMMDEKFDWSIDERLKFSLLMKVLNIRMRESMREDQGGVYGVRARPNMEKYPKPSVNIMISWGCAPENADKLVQTVFHEMDTLRTSGAKDLNLNKAKETTIRDYETNFEKNQYWMSKIKNAVYYEEELLNFEELKRRIQGISGDDLKKLANKYFRDDHYLKVVLLPEEG